MTRLVILSLVAALTLPATTQRESAAAPLRADRIVIEKSARRLTLFQRGREVKRYRVSLGATPEGAKECQGDNKTPEGSYVIASRNSQSRFHRSLRVSYPNSGDRARSAKLRCSPGGDIMIHGLPNGHSAPDAAYQAVDWTAGCVALTDAEIEEVWKAVRDGTPVEIRP